MYRIFAIFIYASLVLAMGCQHAHITVGSNARDYGEAIQTRFKYRLMGGGKIENSPMAMSEKIEICQPEVFDGRGIPVRMQIHETVEESSGDGTFLLNLCSLGIVPLTIKTHLHRKCILMVAGQQLAAVEVCARKGEATTLPLPVPTPLVPIFFSWKDAPCFSGGGKRDAHRFELKGIGAHEYMDLDYACMAYAIASKLKEAEDSGKIDERLAARAHAAQSLSEVAAMRAKIKEDKMSRQGVSMQGDGEPPFEIIFCEPETGKDFAYRFSLRRRGGGAATISDYGIMRSGFRAALRTHYVSAHPDLNPRTLVVDFTKYELNGGVVSGRAAVLSIAPESVSYNAAMRKGVIRVRIGEGQFEEARCWIRKNLVSLVSQKGMSVDGDAVPMGGNFFSEGEAMRDGILEMKFTTE